VAVFISFRYIYILAFLGFSDEWLLFLSLSSPGSPVAALGAQGVTDRGGDPDSCEEQPFVGE